MNANALMVGLARIEVLILIGFVLFCVVLPLWAMRQGIAYALARGLIAFLVCPILRPVLVSRGFPAEQADFVALLGGAVVYLLFPSRSRHVPAGIRRRVIARDLKAKKFDSRKHHIDHRWPFALGGSHTEDNLRLISKTENLRKGKRKPRPTDWF